MRRTTVDRSRDSDDEPIISPPEGDDIAISDDNLAQIKTGYNTSLYRGLNSFSNFALGVSYTALVSSLVYTYGFALGYGGPGELQHVLNIHI